ncbi:MAG: glycosyltransferase family 2 protein [Acidobacteria bacterium]|nr:glycosyltransferase family 2 protein [Acidobacteriota bacterium]
MKLSVIIPCFNEEAVLPALFARLETVVREGAFAENMELIAVDDGSADRTWSILQELAQRHSFLIPIRHEQNCGLPEAWNSGAMAARGEVVCTLDADLQYRPEEIPRLYDVWQHLGRDIVPGARTREGRSFDSRYLLSSGLNLILNRLFGMSLEDNKSGFLVCRRDLFLELLEERDEFRYFQAMIMVAAHFRGYTYYSMPTPFDERAAGSSFLGRFPLRVTAGVLADILRGWVRYRRNSLL